MEFSILAETVTTRSNTGLFEVPSENEYDDNIIDLPLVKTDIVKDLQIKKDDESQESYKKYRNIGICYTICIISVIIILNVVVLFRIPNCDDNCDSNSSDSDTSNSPTSDQNLFPSTHFPTATMTMLPTSYPTIRPTQSSSTQSPTHSPTINPTISPITLSPTTSPITSSSTTSPITFSPTTASPVTASPTNANHPEFHCGATKDEAELCQYSCLVNECPMFEYCYEITTCTSSV